MKKKRILISLSYYVPNISGLTNYAKYLAENLVLKNHDVTILTSRYKKELPQYEEKNGVKVFRERVDLKIGKGVLMFGFPFIAWKLVKQNDVVNCHLPQFESIVLAIFCKILRKKLLVTYHSEIPFTNNFLNNFIAFFLHLIHIPVLIFSNKIIANSEDYANHSYLLRLFLNKIEYIYPPITNNFIGYKQKKQLDKKIKIGFVGRMVEDKGLGILLEAIPLVKKEIKDLEILLVGPDKDVIGNNEKNEITEKIEMNTDNINYLGRLSDQQLAKFYQDIDLLVFPSNNRLESFGMVQLEAMMSGTPVIASNISGARIPVKITGQGLIFQPNSTQDLAQKIIMLSHNLSKYIKSEIFLNGIFSNEKFLTNYEKELNYVE